MKPVKNAGLGRAKQTCRKVFSASALSNSRKQCDQNTEQKWSSPPARPVYVSSDVSLSGAPRPKPKTGLGIMLLCAGITKGLEKRGESCGQKGRFGEGDKHTELLFQPVNDRI